MSQGRPATGTQEGPRSIARHDRAGRSDPVRRGSGKPSRRATWGTSVREHAGPDGKVDVSEPSRTLPIELASARRDSLVGEQSRHARDLESQHPHSEPQPWWFPGPVRVRACNGMPREGVGGPPSRGRVAPAEVSPSPPDASPESRLTTRPTALGGCEGCWPRRR